MSNKPSRHTSVLSIGAQGEEDNPEADMTFSAMSIPPTQSEASDVIQKLNDKLRMQKAHYEKQLTKMKLRVRELEAERNSYRDIVANQTNDTRHTEALAEASESQSPLLKKSVRLMSPTLDGNEASQGSAFFPLGRSGSIMQSAKSSFPVLSNVKGRRTSSVSSKRSNGERMNNMQLDTFIDYQEMQAVNKVRELHKQVDAERMLQMNSIEAENEKLRKKSAKSDARYFAMKARENALRRDFDKLVARTLTQGITAGGSMGGAGPSSASGSFAGVTSHSVHKNTSGQGGGSGSFTARTQPQVTRDFELPSVKGAQKQKMVGNKAQGWAVEERGADGIETSNTPRLPEITSKMSSKGVRRKQDDGLPPISHAKASPRDDVYGKGKEMTEAGEVLSPEVEIIPKTKSLVLESRPPPPIAPPPQVSEFEAEKVNSRGEFQVSESQVKAGEELAANVPKELPSAPWVPTKVEHVDTSKTGPAFRILLSCYVHDLCNLVRVIQPAQDALFKESRELQDYMLGLWNGETGLICPPSNVDLNFLNLQEITPSFCSNAVVKQLSSLMEKKTPGDRWHEEVELLTLSWHSLTASLQQSLSHFQQQIGVWRRTQLTLWNDQKGVPKNIFRSQLLGPNAKTQPKNPERISKSCESSFNSLDQRIEKSHSISPQKVLPPFSSQKKEEPSNEAATTADESPAAPRKANSQVTIVE